MEYRVEQVISLMHDGLHRDLPLDALAGAVGLSPEHLCRVFKAETGVPPAQYLKSLKMRRARSLLETTRLSVKQVMTAVGIADPSHFVRDFRRAYGSPPARYRADYLIALYVAAAPLIQEIKIGQ